jgi:hypothetical protein
MDFIISVIVNMSLCAIKMNLKIVQLRFNVVQ